jgi:uncharacterized membrane protein
MESFISVDLLFRWLHVLFGVTWIGMLYYFNFVQGPYIKEAAAEAKPDVLQKLAPRALWWFRWSAAFTFVTGLVMLKLIVGLNGIDAFITVGAVMGTIMFLNVWLVIWPAQKIVCGIVEGDAAAAGPKALLASRTNTLLSGPMLLCMMASSHGAGAGGNIVRQVGAEGSVSLGLMACLALVALIEANGLFGKLGPIASVKGVIHASIGLTVVCLALLRLV